MFGGKIGLPELAVIVFIALLIFGPKKLGELGKGLGEGIQEFQVVDERRWFHAPTRQPRPKKRSSCFQVSTEFLAGGNSASLSLSPTLTTSRIPVSASSARNIRYTLGTGNPTTLK